MFWQVSRISLLLAVVTCAATAILHTRLHSSQEKPDKSNEGCNSEDGGQKDNVKCNSDGVACMNVAFTLRKTCQMCRNADLMSSGKEDKCGKIALGGGKVKGVKVACNPKWHRDAVKCVYPAIADGSVNWGETGPDKICGCVNKFVDECKNKGLSCILDKIDLCPKVCIGIKMRIKEAQANSFVEAKDENELKNRASVLVDAHGKTSRNASASIMSLDHSMSGKCSQ